jgi:hypothetical protein
MRVGLLVLLGLGGCEGIFSGGVWGNDPAWNDDELDGDADTDVDADTDTDDASGTGTILGTVSVQLFRESSTGDTELVSWEEYGPNFPFGAIFVAAYTVVEETGGLSFHDQDVIATPSVSGDTYTLSVDRAEATSVYVYATLDYASDGVIGSAEPVGIYPETVLVLENDGVSGVDIVIQAQIYGSGSGSGGSGSGGSGSGGSGSGDTGAGDTGAGDTGAGDTAGGGSGGADTSVLLSGNLDITLPYTGGGAKILLYDSAGSGPNYIDSVTPVATESGGEAPWELTVPIGLGTNRLFGAWDANENGLIEPTDKWGAYAVGGANANPITIGSEDMPDLTVELPLGLAPALSPFVRLEGEVTYDSDFSTLASGATVYVAALRTRPSGDFSVGDLTAGFDWQSFSGADLTGTSLSYLLVAPSNEVAYLWAYADIDSDGVLNEVGEPVASFGRTGRLSTGTSNQTGLDMPLQAVSE